MRIQTERLILREMTEEDFGSLFQIFSDPETMQHYHKPFDMAKVHSRLRPLGGGLKGER